MAARRKQKRGPTPPKNRPTPTDRPALKAAAARDLVEMAESEGLLEPLAGLGKGKTALILTNESVTTIVAALDGQATRREDRDTALADVRASVADEREFAGQVLDRLDMIREWRQRQIAKLQEKLRVAELSVSLMPTTGRTGQQITAVDGRIRAAIMREPDLSGAVQAIRRHFEKDEAEAILRDALDRIPEPGAYEADYLDALTAAVVKRHPEMAEALAHFDA